MGSAIDGVSLSIAPGELVALVGRSGCGKSTLLNLAGAMDFPTSGEVFVNGRTTSGASDQQLTKFRREDFIAALQRVKVVPRGPKPIAVLRELGVTPALTVPEPNTWRELLQTLAI